jgi:hypothetical protein
MFALDLAIFDGGVLDDYLDERGALLPGDELAMVERWRSVPLAPYEVTVVQPGASLTMRPLLGGDPVRLADRSLLAQLTRPTKGPQEGGSFGPCPRCASAATLLA